MYEKYTPTYTNNSNPSKTVSKTITFLQSGTEFVGNDAVNTYKGEAKTDTFAYGDIITVKATPTATGVAPLMVASLDEPAAGKMAVYYNSVQVSAPPQWRMACIPRLCSTSWATPTSP